MHVLVCIYNYHLNIKINTHWLTEDGVQQCFKNEWTLSNHWHFEEVILGILKKVVNIYSNQIWRGGGQLPPCLFNSDRPAWRAVIKIMKSCLSKHGIMNVTWLECCMHNRSLFCYRIKVMENNQNSFSLALPFPSTPWFWHNERNTVAIPITL